MKKVVVMFMSYLFLLCSHSAWAMNDSLARTATIGTHILKTVCDKQTIKCLAIASAACLFWNSYAGVFIQYKISRLPFCSLVKPSYVLLEEAAQCRHDKVIKRLEALERYYRLDVQTNSLDPINRCEQLAQAISVISKQSGNDMQTIRREVEESHKKLNSQLAAFHATIKQAENYVNAQPNKTSALYEELAQSIDFTRQRTSQYIVELKEDFDKKIAVLEASLKRIEHSQKEKEEHLIIT